MARRSVCRCNLESVLRQRLLGGMHQRVGMVLASIASRRFLSSAALASASLTIFWMSASETAGRPIRICCSCCRLVLGRDVDDAVGVDVEGDLDLRHAARSRRNAHQVELTEDLVVGRHFAPALEDAMVTAFWLSSAVIPGSSWSGSWCCGR